MLHAVTTAVFRLGSKRRLSFYLTICSLALWWAAAASAEQLPIKTYTTDDGLIRNTVRQILHDSHGYLWLVTPSGLSRFDGYSFKNYTAENAIGITAFWCMIEDRTGSYWIATAGNGLYRFRPQAAAVNNDSRFTLYPLGDNGQVNFVYALYQDSGGRIWAGGQGGLFCLDAAASENQFRRINLPVSQSEAGTLSIQGIAEDKDQNLWVSTTVGLFRHVPDGKIIRYRVPAPYTSVVGNLLYDRDGRLWVENGDGLVVFLPEPATNLSGEVLLPLPPKRQRSSEFGAKSKTLELPSLPGQAARFDQKDGFSGDITSSCQTADGAIWFGIYENGLLRFADNEFRLYARKQGLSYSKVRSLAEDSEGNLWIGTDGAGVMKKVRGGFTGFSESDGVDESYIIFIIEDLLGGITAATDVGRISRFNGKDFLPVQSPSLKQMVSSLIADRTRYYWANPGLKDHNGEWWFATKEGLYRYPAVTSAEQLATLQPKAIYTIDGLQSNDLYAVFEDSRGDLWFSLFKQTGTAVCRWERASGKFYTYGKEYGLPTSEGVVSFAEDRQGNIWLGFSTKTSKNGILARYRGGQFQIFTKEDGTLDGTTRSLFVDRSGRLWIGSSQGGVGRVDDPNAAHPVIQQYTTANGLTDNEINCLTEDRWGNLYIGTGRGLDRLNPTTGQVRHFTAADGLLGTDVRKIYRDSRMNLWIGTGKGLFHFIPQEEAPKPAPSILITRLLVAGADRVISELGERQLADLELANNENNLQVDFVSPSVSFAPTIRYEYKLEGSNDQWLPLSDLRTVNFANLSPGTYRFQVQAINSEGIRSPEPATIRFTILPPLWRRWWFLTLMALLVGAAITAIYQYRIKRLLEIERVRTRIAADLHDDIGASLSHIAVVSEVVRHQLAEQESPLSKNLSVIARISRDAVDSMSDIVWAVNPQRDHLYDLTRRMRSFASELLPARNIAFQFVAPPEEQDIRLGADVRRQLFLIYKESLNNLVRHSGCTRASIEMHIEGRRLVLKVSDNGKGFDTNNGVSGNGLKNMRKRAESLGGRVEFTSAKGGGTDVLLEMPHHPVHKFN